MAVRVATAVVRVEWSAIRTISGEATPPRLTARPRVTPLAVPTVSGLLRELILALTGPGIRTAAARERLEQVTLDQLLESSEQPLHLPEPGDDRLRAAA